MELDSPASAVRTLRRRLTTAPGEGQDWTAVLAQLEAAEGAELATMELLLAQPRWECVATALVLGEGLCLALAGEAPAPELDAMLSRLLDEADALLEHDESRMRAVVARLLGAAARVRGAAVYERFGARLVDVIRANYTRAEDQMEPAIAGADGSGSIALDDTSGWKAMETSLAALSAVVVGTGHAFVEAGHLTPELVAAVVTNCGPHPNRFVRETAYGIAASLCEVAEPADLEGNRPLTQALVDALALGLADNWSQVRYAASVALRSFLLTLPAELRVEHHPVLVPRLALNRYYLAEGVRIYNQETWRTVFGDSGRDVVASVIDHVVDYYCGVSDADNHIVRETACACIAELAVKVDPERVRPHVGRLLDALLICFADESWPCRTAACTATGRFVQPEPFHEAVAPYMDQLYGLWFEHVSDNVWSVREDAAGALGCVVESHGEPALARVLDWLRAHVNDAASQVPQTEEELAAKANDVAAHTGGQVFSCGSLAPKLRKGGCSDCTVWRPKEQWEFSDGAVYLVRELCRVAPEAAVEFMPAVAELARIAHFPQSHQLHETIWKQLPVMAQSLGKKVFKRYLDPLLLPLASSLESGNQLEQHAAGDFAAFASTFVGPTIFRGRLEGEDPDLVPRVLNSPFLTAGLPPAMPSDRTVL